MYISEKSLNVYFSYLFSVLFLLPVIEKDFDGSTDDKLD